MIPPLTADGALPPGIYDAEDWSEVEDRFGGTEHRRRLLVKLRLGLDNLRDAGCPWVLIDGSFVQEYQVTKQQLRTLAEALAEAQQKANPDQPEVFRQAGLNGIRFLMEDLEAELTEYEQLVADQMMPSPLADR